MRLTDDEQVEFVIPTYRNNFLVQAMLEDYAVRMAKVDGMSAAKTIEKLNRISFEKLDELLKKWSDRKLPEKVKKTKKVKIIYTIAACLKLQIHYETARFDIKKLLEEINSKNSGMREGLRGFFKAYARYRLTYIGLKKDGRGSYSHYQTLEAEMNAQREIIDKLLK